MTISAPAAITSRARTPAAIGIPYSAPVLASDACELAEALVLDVAIAAAWEADALLPLAAADPAAFASVVASFWPAASAAAAADAVAVAVTSVDASTAPLTAALDDPADWAAEVDLAVAAAAATVVASAWAAATAAALARESAAAEAAALACACEVVDAFDEDVEVDADCAAAELLPLAAAVDAALDVVDASF